MNPNLGGNPSQALDQNARAQATQAAADAPALNLPRSTTGDNHAQGLTSGAEGHPPHHPGSMMDERRSISWGNKIIKEYDPSRQIKIQQSNRRSSLQKLSSKRGSLVEKKDPATNEAI